MRMITVNTEAFNAICALSPVIRTIGLEQTQDGHYLIWLDDAQVQRMEERQFPNETMSDTIIRAIALMKPPH